MSSIDTDGQGFKLTTEGVELRIVWCELDRCIERGERMRCLALRKQHASVASMRPAFVRERLERCASRTVRFAELSRFGVRHPLAVG